jgi:hypothetical protein
MIGGKRINAGLDIGEILLEQESHIRIEPSAVRHGRMGEGAQRGLLTFSPPRRLRQPSYREAVPDIPSDPRQLAGAVRDACGKAGERIAHASLSGSSQRTIQHKAGKTD